MSILMEKARNQYQIEAVLQNSFVLLKNDRKQNMDYELN